MIAKKKVFFAVVALAIMLTIGLVVGVFYYVVDGVVENRTVSSIGELATHDRNSIVMTVEYNWSTLERIGKRLRRYASTLTDKRKTYEYLVHEADESIFDYVFLITEDGSYYTDLTYRTEGTPDYYNYKTMFDGGLKLAVKFDNLPFIKYDKAVVYGYRLTDELAGIEVDGGSPIFALVGICMRHSIKNGLVIDSFPDDNGNYRGYSSVITINGEYVVNRAEDANVDAYNWFEHIDKCENSEMDSDRVRELMSNKEEFWFFHSDGDMRELNYCARYPEP